MRISVKGSREVLRIRGILVRIRIRTSDPEPDAISVSDLQDGKTKKLVYSFFCLFLTFFRYIYMIFRDKKS
jgi:hypothetical protein